jgi:hypothetical protein
VQIVFGNARPSVGDAKPKVDLASIWDADCVAAAAKDLFSQPQVLKLRNFHRRLKAQGLASSYPAAHAQLAGRCALMAALRRELISHGKIKPLPDPAEAAADGVYAQTIAKLCTGLAEALKPYAHATDVPKHKVWEAWAEAATD